MDAKALPARRRRDAILMYSFFLLVCAAIIGAATVFYLKTEATLRQGIYNELSAIADLKLDQILKWHSDRLAFAQTVLDDQLLLDAAVRRTANREDKDDRKKMQVWMSSTKKQFRFSNIALIDTQCRPLFSLDTASPPFDSTLLATIAESKHSGTPQFSDFHFGASRKIQIDLITPIRKPGDTTGAVAFFLFEIDPKQFLFPLVESWPLPSRSAETLLLRKMGDSVEFINELRHRKKTALSFRLPLTKPRFLAAEAIRHGRGVYDRVDYRDMPVLGAVRAIPGTPWFMVAKVDKADIMAPMRLFFVYFMAFLIVALLFAFVLGLLIYRHQRSLHYRDLYQAEQDKNRSEARFRALFENMTEGVALHEIVHDNRGTPVDYMIIDVNPAFSKQTGIPADKAKGRLATDLYSSPTPPYFEEYLQVTQTQIPYTFETFYPPMGKYFSISAFSPGIDLFATVFEDISRRKINEEERKLTIDIFKLLNAANSTQDLIKNVLSVLRSWSGCEAAGIRLREGEDFPYYEVQGFPELFVKKEMHLCEHDLAGQIIRDNTGNPTLECMCGTIICGRFDPSKPFFTKSGSFWTNCTTELLASTTEADRQSRTRNRCNGEGYESVALIPLRAGGTVFGLIQLNDKQKNRFTRETIALYERLAESIGMALAQRKATEALLASEKRLAEEKERLLVTLRSIGDAVITTDINGIITLMNRVAERLTGWDLADAVGQPLNVVFHIINEKTRERCDNPVDRVLKTGGMVGLANHTALIARDGRELVIADSGAPIRDAQSNIIGVVLVFRDITVQRKTEEALRNTQRLESVGVLAGGIAHDFNNLLGGIFGYLSLAIDENNEKKTGQYLGKIMETMDRARALTRQLLTFSKGGAPVRKRGPLFPFIQETAQFALSGANVSCFFDIEPGLRQCDFDKNQIGQAIDNIVINAQQAMPSGGVITITARNVLLAEQQVGMLKKGPYVRLSVKDTGIGIPSDILPRIFDPFFTTKQKGSGLGLATAFSIITRHEGYIEAQSSPGNGATFHVYLPATSDAGEIIHQEALRTQHRGQGTIIIMDDEEVMRDTLSSMLTSYGYSVIQLRDGSEVLPRFKEVVAHKQRPVAIILDLTVPGGMGGKEAGSTLRNYDKTVPIFISSGYAEDPILANPENYGFTGSITKPYMKSELAALLEKHLGKSAK